MQTKAIPANNLPWPDGLLDGPLLALAAAARRYHHQTGQRVAPSTLWRWSVEGKRGVYLPHLRYGRRVMTSEAALTWFGQASALAAMKAEVAESKPWMPEADLQDFLDREGL